MKFSRTFLALAMISTLGACAQERAEISSLQLSGPVLGYGQMPEGRPVAAPRGYTDMCGREAALCGRPAMDAAFAPALDRVDLLDAVNRRVNGATRQVSDELAFHKDEYWRPAGAGFGAKGDCEDIAIEKRLELQRAGVPDSDMFYAVGYRRELGLHTVLVARTRGGDVVLDSRTPYLSAWGAAPYVWVSRQSSADPRSWHAVEAMPTVVLATAAIATRPGA